MKTIIANFSHVDALVFNQNKTTYSSHHMLATLSGGAKNINSSDEYVIIKDFQGKPWAYRKDDESLSSPFSITTSHSYPYVYSGSDEKNVLIGCDVERIRNFEDSFLNSFMHHNELPYLQNLDTLSRNKIATMVWVIKESLLKALGTGLTVNPKRLDISSIVSQKKKGTYTINFDGKDTLCTVLFLQEIEGFVFCFLKIL